MELTSKQRAQLRGMAATMDKLKKKWEDISEKRAAASEARQARQEEERKEKQREKRGKKDPWER